jgi:hypothetical protein
LPTRRRTAKSGKDWSIGFAKCITSASGAGVAKDHNRTLDQVRPWGTIRRGRSRSASRFSSAGVGGSGPHNASTKSKRACISSNQPHRPRARRSAPAVRQP